MITKENPRISIPPAHFIYHLLTLIPPGKVSTYGDIAKFFGIKSPRLVGRILHKNKFPKKYPCYKVVFFDGKLAEKYGAGGAKVQRKRLEKSGVPFKNDKVDMKKAKLKLRKPLRWYFGLYEKYGNPGDWPWSFPKLKCNLCTDAEGNKKFKVTEKKHSRDEIIIGSILTQNTAWRNVERAIENLRREKMNTINSIYRLRASNFEKLKKLIRPAGFYRQKADHLLLLCRFFIEGYGSYENFFKLPIDCTRDILLQQKGIGEETTDTILLYAGNKLTFVVDAYTRKFLRKKRGKNLSEKEYVLIQKYFTENLPVNLQLYKDYHALIVMFGKDMK